MLKLNSFFLSITIFLLTFNSAFASCTVEDSFVINWPNWFLRGIDPVISVVFPVSILVAIINLIIFFIRFKDIKRRKIALKMIVWALVCLVLIFVAWGFVNFTAPTSCIF